MGTVNHVAVLATVVVSHLLGFVWYSVLFGRPWALGYRLEADALKKTHPAAMGSTVVAAVIFTYAMAIAVGRLGVVGVGGGVALGAGAWLGIIAPRYALHAIFGRVGRAAVAIDLGFDLLVTVVAGAILAAW